MNLYQSATYLHILCGLLILGHFKIFVSAEEYDYSDDEESPAEQKKMNATNAMSTVMPYFEDKSVTISVKNGEKAVLECPVKNFQETKHSVLWYKDDTIIANGPEPLTKAYQVDDKSLIIEQVTEETAGNYYCSVMPQNIQRYVTVKIEEANNAQMLLAANTACITGIFLVLQKLLMSTQLLNI